MKIDVHIRDTTTGEHRVYQDDYDWQNDDGVVYQYGMGNYSCDCNRELFFCRAIGETEPSFADIECGEIRFVIEMVVERETGRQIYVDPPFS